MRETQGSRDRSCMEEGGMPRRSVGNRVTSKSLIFGIFGDG